MGTPMNPPVYALLPPGGRVVGPTAVTIVVPFSKRAPRTVPGTVTDKDTAVPAVVPTVESTVGLSFRWFYEMIGDFNLGSGTFVYRLLCTVVLGRLRG